MNADIYSTFLLNWSSYAYQAISLPMTTLLHWGFALLLLFITLGQGLFILLNQDQARDTPNNPFNPLLTQIALILLLLILTPIIRPFATQLIYLMSDAIYAYFYFINQLGNTKVIIKYMVIFIPLAVTLSELLLREFDKISDRMILSFENAPWSRSLIGTIFILPVGKLVALTLSLLLSHFGARILLSIV